MDSRPFITVVSGLPRSGTSMMMQMLAAGGMPILSDGVRAADEDNPRGYFEFEAVKRTREDASWVPTAVGKAVKMVTVLLRDLPPGFEYRVILMRRDLDEVLQSQKVMLGRLGRTGAQVSEERIKALFFNELEGITQWISGRKNFRLLTVEYQECIQEPESVAGAVAGFVAESCLDLRVMISAIDGKLRRQSAR